ncbi:MAG: hypothetical protein Q9219_005639 [cf. Caloplaca sp. 3 TL-2023]
MDSDRHRGFLDRLYPVWTHTRSTSPLRRAVHAVALSLLEAWSGLNPNSTQSLARAYYVQGVAAIRQWLENSRKIDNDVLMATLMLDMYEGITSFCGGRPHKSPHIAGSKALMQNLQQQASNCETSQKVLLAVRSHVKGRAFSTRELISKDELIWITGARTIPRTPKFELEEIDIEVAKLQASAEGLLANLTIPFLSVSELLTKANDLDQQLVSWAATIPEDWVPTCVWDPECIPENVREAGCYQAHCIIDKSVFIANILNRHCCSRIKVQLVILACLEHLHDPLRNDSIHENASNTIQDLAATICASVPYHLGDRVQFRRFDDKSVQYPRMRSDITPAEHYDAAAAYAGMFVTKQLIELLPPGIPLRAGQREWILGQLTRIKKIYLASSA